jgi:hypothetical protein
VSFEINVQKNKEQVLVAFLDITGAYDRHFGPEASEGRDPDTAHVPSVGHGAGEASLLFRLSGHGIYTHRL